MWSFAISESKPFVSLKTFPIAFFSAALFCAAQDYPAAKPDVEERKSSEPQKRIELNLLGKTDTAAGESRRNENIQFNLVDNNALKELNVRLGTVATIIEEFRPERGYFGAEFGNSPTAVLHVTSPARSGLHGTLYANHQNSVFSARSFFQVGDVKPARENDYGFTLGASPWNGSRLSLDASQQKLRGNVNGNVLVPGVEERTPLTTDPAKRALVTRFLAAYPRELPNRTDVNPRALNTNSQQVIDNENGAIRLDQSAGQHDRVFLQYFFTSQNVNAFQLVAGQNPDTNTKSHRGRITWNRQWGPATITDLSAGFDRLGSLLAPEENAVGPTIAVSGLESLGPQGGIPIDRAQNLFRYAGQLRRTAGTHTWTAGFGALRRQLNGRETDVHRGYFSFSNEFGRDGITNLRLATPSSHLVSIGDVHRGFRNWESQWYTGDQWQARPSLSLRYGVRYQLATRPVEVNGRNIIPYDCDCNNLAPQLGFAYRAPRRAGVIRASYGVQFGEIFPVTFQQVRFSPPGNRKILVTVPDLLRPLGAPGEMDASLDAKANLYLLDPELALPYSHQYNFSWEPEISRSWKLQFGYVGSRSHKLLIMWYLNRGHAVPGIPQTTATLNARRPDVDYAEKRWVLNGSRGYYDAARVSLVLPRWRGLSVETAYWFSKAMDLGASYTNTAHDADSRLSRSQSEFETHHDMRGLSSFDQPHAFLLRGSWAMPVPARAGSWLVRQILGAPGREWTMAGVVLLKHGTPFQVISSDGPGFGNVDGSGGDRPNLLDASILGRTVGDPDTSRKMLPRSAFSYIQATEEQGDLGRNVFRKGGIRNLNASLARTWPIQGDKRLTFRAESINLTNTPQFAEPGVELPNANFGQITNTLNDGRTFRFHLQFGW